MSFNGNLFVPSEWSTGVLECWNIGDKNGKQTFLMVKNSFKPIIPLFHYSNWGEATKFIGKLGSFYQRFLFLSNPN